MTSGDVVYWRSKHGCRFGHLVKLGYKLAHVRIGDSIKRVPRELVKPWPPAKPGEVA